MHCWVIAVSCFLINFLILGGARLSPLLFVYTMERFNVDRPEASFPYVLCYFMRSVTGPIIGVMERKFGLRAVTLSGVIMAAVGVGGCFFAESARTVTIVWGIIYGSGFGFAIALLPAIINMYFDENRSKANGFALAGACAGGFIEPLFAKGLLNYYGLSGTYLILCGLILHGIPAAMLLVKPDPQSTKLKEKNSKAPLVKTDNVECEKANLTNIDSKNVSKYSQDALESKNILNDKQSQIGTTNVGYVNYSFDADRDNEKTVKITDPEHIHDPQVEYSNGIIFRDHKLEHPVVYGTFKCMENVYENQNYLVLRRISGELAEKTKPLDTEERTRTCKEVRSNSLLPLAIENDGKEKSSWDSFQVLTQSKFVLMVITQSLFGFVLAIAWTTVVDFVRDKGIPRDQEVYFMMFLPAGDMVGRLGLGFVTDGGYMTPTGFSCLSFLLYGLGAAFMVMSEGFVFIMLSVLFFAFFSGGLAVVFPVVIDEFIEEEFKSMALASRFFLLGPLTLVISPLIGFFRTKLGSYSGLYYTCAVVSFVCAGLVMLIPVTARRAEKKSQQCIT